MPTLHQIKTLDKKLKEYKRRYLRKQYSELDESATRLMVNSFLTDVLGYKELDDIKTEYRIRGEYADYVIQVKRKKHFVVEVKSIDLDLNSKHLRQSTNYAANEGIDWVILTNGREVKLYRVNFGKPITTTEVLSMDLADKNDFKKAAENLIYLSKKSIEKNEIEEYWARFNALAPEALAKLIYSEEVARILRKLLKKETDMYFQMDDIASSLYDALTQSVDMGKPKLRPLHRNKKKKSR